MSKTKEVSGGKFVQTNRLFIELKGYGQCDDRGRCVFGIGMKGGKIKADPDKPFRTLILPLIAELLPLCRYSDDAEMEADLKAFREYADGVLPRQKSDSK